MKGKMPQTLYAFNVPVPRWAARILICALLLLLALAAAGIVVAILTVIPPLAAIGLGIAFAIMKYYGKRRNQN